MLSHALCVCLCLLNGWSSADLDPYETPQPLFLCELPLELMKELLMPSCSRVYDLNERNIRWWEYLYSLGYCTQAEYDTSRKVFVPVFCLIDSMARVWNTKQRYANFWEFIFTYGRVNSKESFVQ